MLVEAMFRYFEVLIHKWWILSVYVFSMVILSKIKLSFWFTSVLYMAKIAFHKVYYKFTFTIKVIVIMLVKLLECTTFLQHRFHNFEKHLVEKPILFFAFFYTLLFTIFLHPSKSLRFLLLLKAKIGICWKMSWNSSLIWSRFQLLVITFFTLCRVRLYVNISCIVFVFFFSFSFTLRALFCQKFMFSEYTLFYKQHFCKQLQAVKLAKNQAKAKQHPETELLLFEIYSLSSSTLSSKNSRRYTKKCTKSKYVCLDEVICLMAT